ncbi:GTPase HflX [PVC group bacterium (ex Bugula neritina AB1)]|nr:GTPase HflX [PVC group bacterium (ex Bugula neritina AB1)]
MHSNKNEKYKAILAGIYMDDKDEALYSIDELKSLAEANDLEVGGEILQKKNKPDGSFYLGEGKVEELAEALKRCDAKLVIFDDELRSFQARNLSKRLKCRVLDRSELILDIFSNRARTKEAKLQVEVARLKYEMSRLQKMWTHFGRIDGSIGSRGMGETQLEIDKRRTRKRIDLLEKDLKKLVKTKSNESKSRQNIFKVALVGYTNAGKSTLLNVLAKTDVFTKNLLFATLDTTTRKINLGASYQFLMSDTVGFVRKLPHQLVASFHATLSEVKEADLLLYVIDFSDKEHLKHIETVEKVLQQIDADSKKTIIVFNKCDCLDDLDLLENQSKNLFQKNRDFVYISAQKGRGLEELKSKIKEYMDENRSSVTLAIPWDNSQAMTYVSKYAHILKEWHVEEKRVMEVKIEKKYIGKFRHFIREGLE